jgi:hypothetical protein
MKSFVLRSSLIGQSISSQINYISAGGFTQTAEEMGRKTRKEERGFFGGAEDLAGQVSGSGETYVKGPE